MKVSQVLADQLRAVGFNVDLQVLSGAVAATTRAAAATTTLRMQAFCPGYIAENLELFHSKFYVPLGEPAPWYERNSFRYANPELDAIVDQMFTVQPSDIGTMQALYRDALAIWLRDLPVVPVDAGAGAGAVQQHLLAGLAVGEQPVEHARQLVGNVQPGAQRLPERAGRLGARHPAHRPLRLVRPPFARAKRGSQRQ